MRPKAAYGIRINNVASSLTFFLLVKSNPKMQQPTAAEIEKMRTIQVEGEKEAIELRLLYTKLKLSVGRTLPPQVAK